MQGRTLEFWYEFASTYSYLSAMRIEGLAGQHGVSVAWKPFLLGPIFAAQGWATSPFTLYPAKGRYMIRDMERRAADYGLQFHAPMPFPQNSLAAARMALVGVDAGWAGAFTREVYLAQFAGREDIGQRDTLERALGRTAAAAGGLDLAGIFARSASQLVKDQLKEQTSQAQTLGVFWCPVVPLRGRRAVLGR